MNRLAFPAMGTTIVLVGGTERSLRAARRRIEGVEATCSRFDPRSELSHLNRRPPGFATASPDLLSVLAVAEDLRDRTSGLFDPAIGRRLTQWGYDTTFRDVTDRSQPPPSEPSGHWRVVPGGVIRDPGVQIDLGGIVKGWVCDEVVEEGLASIASAGGDARSSSPDAIAELIDPASQTVAARIRVGIGAVATSTTLIRAWNAGDARAHHIIDPRTGDPARSPVVTATVRARTAAEAEAGAKAMLLLGTDGLAWCDRMPWLTGAAAIWHTGAVFATGSLELAA